ncbi:MAG: hypothetical protein V4489_00100, partial [Chlamydiota bacterium]
SNPDLQRLTGEILSTIASRPSSPRFIFNPSPYQSNPSLSPTFFEESCEQSIQRTAKKVKEALGSNKTYLAISVLHRLEKERRDIALEQGSIDANRFGVERSVMDDLTTPLLPNTAYEEYEKKFLNTLSQLCKTHKTDLLNGRQFEISSKKMQGISSNFLCKIVDTQKILSCLSEQESLHYDQQAEVDFLLFISNHFFKKKLEKLEDLETFLNQPDIVFMHAKTQGDITKQQIPLSQYFFFFHKSELEKDLPEFAKTELEWNLPFEESQKFLKTPSLLTLVHPNPYYAGSVMSYIDGHQLPLCFNSTSESALKENLGLFFYLYAQATPYERGSASIGEMKAKTVCEAKNYKMEYGEAISFENERPLPDLDALTSTSLDEYMPDFLSKCVLTPLLPPSEKNLPL